MMRRGHAVAGISPEVHNLVGNYAQFPSQHFSWANKQAVCRWHIACPISGRVSEMMAKQKLVESPSLSHQANSVGIVRSRTVAK
jgi:hypothetical protein